jgi:hypothetical protein
MRVYVSSMSPRAAANIWVLTRSAGATSLCNKSRHVHSTSISVRPWIFQQALSLFLTRAERCIATMMKLRRMRCAEYFRYGRHFEGLNLLPINAELGYLPTLHTWNNIVKRSANHLKSISLRKLCREGNLLTYIRQVPEWIASQIIDYHNSGF